MERSRFVNLFEQCLELMLQYTTIIASFRQAKVTSRIPLIQDFGKLQLYINVTFFICEVFYAKFSQLT
ncbi:hypothetical protein T4E_10401 [Trichinella pseudospiralis]|uniref:Uncharacterized protein n=1 Tax=Trichinella pseudospiralis TaxID=6337 RepID=A0A0V0XKS7_TRIPS|nr:hypothetical protein T4E_10401 [Trichinella pseudospiralis]